MVRFRVGAAVACWLMVALSMSAAHAKSLRILLTSDVYKMSGERERGGHARLAAAVNAERAKGGAFLYVHAGDAISPCLMCGFDQGEHLLALMNKAPPDVFVPGNHEYDFGKDIFLKRMREAKFPIFAANLTSPDGTVEALLQKSKIIDLDGIKIGVVGATADDAPQKSNPQDLKIAPIVETVHSEAQALRAGGADFVIAIVHASRDTDRRLIASRAADLILSGDDHDLSWSYDGKTGFVEGGEDATHLNVVELDIDVVTTADGRRTEWTPAFRIIDTKSVVPDPAVSAQVAKYEAILAGELDVPVATAPAAFDSKSATVRARENLLGNVVADALREGYGADLALMNGGGLRGGKEYAAGQTITRRDILSELPFSNKAVVVELKGEDIRTILEHALALLPQPAGRFPHISGAVVTFDAAAQAGARIAEISINGEPLRAKRVYKVVTNDFLVRGGDGYPLLGAARLLVRPEDGRLVANDVLVYLAKHGFGDARVGVRVLPKP